MTGTRRLRGLIVVAIAVAAVVADRESGWRLAGATALAQAAAGEDAVRATLQRYAAALESLDAEAVKKVQPSIPAESLARAFRDMRELKVVIEDVRVLSLDGATARVSCNVKQTLTPRAGSQQTTAVTRVVRLRRDGNVWVIDGFER